MKPASFRFASLLASVTAATVWLASAALPAPAKAEPPRISTHAAASSVIDVKSNRIVFQENGDERMRIASLTKVMTAIVAIENADLTDIVKVSSRAYGKEGSSIYLHLGEEMTLHNMLYGLMLRSGNDAATAIAEHVGGSVEGFVYLMNEKARMLGMKNSSFKNPHGLDEEGHYSSANDMAVLTAYALKNKVFQEIVKTKVKRAPNPNEDWDYKWVNKNKMLNMYEGADGVKTGYTKLAHRTLISSATRNGQQFAVVTLNDGDDWNDHKRLLDYAFQHYPSTTIVRAGERVEAPNLVVARSFEYPLAQGEIGDLRKKIVLEDELSTDYRLGERGRLELYLKGKLIGSLPLFEDGSERYKVQEQATFLYTKYEEREQSYGDVFRTLLKELLTGGAKEGP
ncbi:D-alanyl-D-alanine carboxypeptidase family protein [Paenibacillus sp.]|uniref:D-alanyl-D-alanine carboxypeptidase family protein n=1 Tax=Paenibacillus sp. TaxID=58172 RepID=UPI002D4FBFEE|nr:D-alanyl-D-alanine carboxypeptidase family protein [Paenibacillus sp.]HZG85196.1 D-alanyl-D-alanine carboxypeptidase family protein [Paenibacillus sp.]